MDNVENVVRPVNQENAVEVTRAEFTSEVPAAVPSDPRTAEKKRFLASRCIACDRPLCDAVSVSVGIGPECRRRLGLARTLRHRPEANDLLALIAEASEGNQGEKVLNLVTQLRTLDPLYEKLADRIEKLWLDSARLLILQQTDGRLGIRSPYSPKFVDFARENQMRFQLFRAEGLPDVLKHVNLAYEPQNVLTSALQPAKNLIEPKPPKFPELLSTAETPATSVKPDAPGPTGVRL